MIPFPIPEFNKISQNQYDVNNSPQKDNENSQVDEDEESKIYKFFIAYFCCNVYSSSAD